MPDPDKALAQLRAPTQEDGEGVYRLVRDAGTLDLNSAYMYILLCDRFAETCVVAEQHGRVVGTVLGFLPPRDPRTIFVWQVGVSPDARGQGLAGRLLQALVERPACEAVTHMETTITPSNTASDALFRSFARRQGADVEVFEGYRGALFPEEGHEPERLYRIGPLESLSRKVPS